MRVTEPFVLNRFEFAIRSILVKGIVDDGEISTNVFLLDEYAFNTHIGAHFDSFFIKNRITLENHFISFDAYYLTGIFIYEIFHPASEYAGSQTAAYIFLQGFFLSLHFIGHSE